MGARSRLRSWLRLRLDESGAALVEFALVLPILMMIVLGMVSAGVGYNRKITITHAAREAARYGATLSVAVPGDMDTWLSWLRQRVIEDASGTLDAATPGLLICVAYVHPLGVGDDGTTSLGGADPSAPCFDDGRPDSERRVQVHAERAHDFEALFWRRTITIGTEAVARYEAFLGAG